MREVKASRDVVNAILVYQSPSEERRPLEVIKGLELVEPRSGTGMRRATMKLVGAYASWMEPFLGHIPVKISRVLDPH